MEKGLKFAQVASICDMANMTAKKNWMKKLTKISEMLEGKKLSECTTGEEVVKDTGNKRLGIATVALDLYGLCKAILDDPKSFPDSTAQQQVVSNDISHVVCEELKKILPLALKDAMETLKIPVAKAEEEEEAESEPVVKTHTLVMEHKDAEGEENPITKKSWTEVVKKNVTGALRTVPVEGTTVKDGKALVRFKDQESLDEAASVLGKDYKVSTETRDKKKVYPKMIIYGVDEDIKKKEDLLDDLLKKNKDIKDLKDADEHLDIIYHNKVDKTAVIEVSPAIRASIKKKQNKIHLGLGLRNVRDHVHVTQCYHCQEIGHKSKSSFCKLKATEPSVCFYCAGRHDSRDCNKKNDRKKHKCSNCLKSKVRSYKDNAGTHNATDTLCPYVIKETEIMMSKTMGYKEAKNLYVQKIQQRQRALRR